MEASQRDASYGRDHTHRPGQDEHGRCGSACSRCPLMRSVCLLPRALAVVTSAHQPRAYLGVWAHWRGLGRACVGMHGCGPTAGLKRASTAASLYSCDGLGCAKHGPLPIDDPASDHAESTTDAHRSALVHASGACAWVRGAGTHSFLCLISLSQLRASKRVSNSTGAA